MLWSFRAHNIVNFCKTHPKYLFVEKLDGVESNVLSRCRNMFFYRKMSEMLSEFGDTHFRVMPFVVEKVNLRKQYT